MVRRSLSFSLAGALLVSMVSLVGLAGCGNTPPPAQNRVGQAPYSSAPVNRPPQQGMSTKKKLILLTAAAAAAYWYNKHNQQAQSQAQANPGARTMNDATGAAVSQYYRSKNGRIYYRDAQHQVHWVTPPKQVSVPAEEAPMYQRQASDFAYYH